MERWYNVYRKDNEGKEDVIHTSVSKDRADKFLKMLVSNLKKNGFKIHKKAGKYVTEQTGFTYWVD